MANMKPVITDTPTLLDLSRRLVAEAAVRLLDQLVSEREEISATMKGVFTRAADDHRDISEPEDANLRDLKTRADKLDERIAELRSILERREHDR